MILIVMIVLLLSDNFGAIDLSTVEPQVAKKIETLQQQVSKNPQSAEAWGKLAMNLHAHDFQAESIPCYAKAAELNQKEFHWTYYAAIAEQEIGSPEAIPLFEESLKRKKNYAPLHLRYGQALFNTGRTEDSLVQFQNVLKLDPKSAEAYLAVARISFTLNNYDDCVSNLLKAIEFNPNLGEAHALLSEVYRSKNDFEKADKELLASMQLPKKVPPPDPELKAFLMEGVSSYWYELRGRVLLQNQDFDGAIRELTQAAKALPDARIYDTIGIAYQHQKKYGEAAEQHRKALSLDPTSAGTMNNLASALTESGNVDEAISYMKQAISIQPEFAYSYIHLASLLKKRNQKEAMLTLRQGNQRLPQNSQIALELAHLLATSSDESVRNCSEAIQIANLISTKKQNKDAESLDVLSAGYACSNDFDRAVELSRQAEQLAVDKDLKKKILEHLQQYLRKQNYEE
ncbi:MAG TPA: tetratricopeptide repeat protein [Acidobacteriota bacterium]|nr:tetratricopeptide repeat protein [Acidobacteriota bacterium]